METSPDSLCRLFSRAGPRCRDGTPDTAMYRRHALPLHMGLRSCGSWASVQRQENARCRHSCHSYKHGKWRIGLNRPCQATIYDPLDLSNRFLLLGGEVRIIHSRNASLLRQIKILGIQPCPFHFRFLHLPNSSAFLSHH